MPGTMIEIATGWGTFCRNKLDGLGTTHKPEAGRYGTRGCPAPKACHQVQHSRLAAYHDRHQRVVSRSDATSTHWPRPAGTSPQLDGIQQHSQVRRRAANQRSHKEHNGSEITMPPAGLAPGWPRFVVTKAAGIPSRRRPRLRGKLADTTGYPLRSWPVVRNDDARRAVKPGKPRSTARHRDAAGRRSIP